MEIAVLRRTLHYSQCQLCNFVKSSRATSYPMWLSRINNAWIEWSQWAGKRVWIFFGSYGWNCLEVDWQVRWALKIFGVGQFEYLGQVSYYLVYGKQSVGTEYKHRPNFKARQTIASAVASDWRQYCLPNSRRFSWIVCSCLILESITFFRCRFVLHCVHVWLTVQ